MTQQRDDSRLSTADMVSAGSQAQSNGQQDTYELRPDGAAQRELPAERQMAPANGEAAREYPAPGANGADGATAAHTANGAVAHTGDAATPLFPTNEAGTYRSRWEEVQTGFVDEPRHAVEEADHLVAEVIKRVAEVFAEERSKLEAQWSSGGQVDTEALRLALKRYRSFFERLLSA